MSSSSSLPLITIGLTCFNARDTIGRALDSALAQDWPNLEIIVVDDSSTDDSVSYVRERIEGINRARLICQPTNTGAAAARNAILENAQGELVVFFDDDDESLSHRVRTQYEALAMYEQTAGTTLVACYASGSRRYSNGYELDLPAIGSRPKVPTGNDVASYLLFNGRVSGLFYGTGTPTCALMARKRTFGVIGGFDPDLRRAEDVDFAIRLALAGGHFIGCPERLFIQFATVASDKTPEKNLDAELALTEKYADYLRRQGRYDYARAWFKIRYYHFSKQRFAFLAAMAVFLLRHPFTGCRHLSRSLPGRWNHERRMNE